MLYVWGFSNISTTGISGITAQTRPLVSTTTTQNLKLRNGKAVQYGAFASTTPIIVFAIELVPANLNIVFQGVVRLNFKGALPLT